MCGLTLPLTSLIWQDGRGWWSLGIVKSYIWLCKQLWISWFHTYLSYANCPLWGDVKEWSRWDGMDIWEIHLMEVMDDRCSMVVEMWYEQATWSWRMGSLVYPCSTAVLVVFIELIQIKKEQWLVMTDHWLISLPFLSS